MNMPQIGGQFWQQFLHICAFSVPSDQSMNGKSVPQVVKSWLITRPVNTLYVGPLA
jgi:hypothetical protein